MKSRRVTASEQGTEAQIAETGLLTDTPACGVCLMLGTHTQGRSAKSVWYGPRVSVDSMKLLSILSRCIHVRKCGQGACL
jgi:hypothetical protein